MPIDKTAASLAAAVAAGDPTGDATRKLIGQLAQGFAQTTQPPQPKPELAAYPMDDDGYARSFDPLTQSDALVDTWRRYGMVVGKSILTPDECAHTIASIRTRFNALSRGTCDLEKPESWANMPVDANGTPVLSRGFLDIYHDALLADVRQNVRAYLHHALIWQRADLWTSFDRLGVKLPHHGESGALPLHVDQNPVVHPDFKTVQGVLALTDCPKERGTFLAVPGSRGYFNHYAAMILNRGEYVPLDMLHPMTTELLAHAQVIPLRAGDLVSWDSRTTHANTANMSDTARMVMYLSAGPAREDSPEALAARKEAFRTGEGSNVREALMHASKKPRYSDAGALARIRVPETLTPLGRLLYGLDSYAGITAPSVA